MQSESWLGSNFFTEKNLKKFEEILTFEIFRKKVWNFPFQNKIQIWPNKHQFALRKAGLWLALFESNDLDQLNFEL